MAANIRKIDVVGPGAMGSGFARPFAPSGLDDPKFRPRPLLNHTSDASDLGRKTGPRLFTCPAS